MSIGHLLSLLPLVLVPFVQAQNEGAVNITTTTVANSANATAADDGTPPIYTAAECDYWIGMLVSADADSSDGLSESEYHSFLSNIEDPPYISKYFTTINNFDELPWVFRVVHKSLACHCEKLGFGEGCCEGDSAEIRTPGSTNNSTDGATEREIENYHDLLCQQLSYVLEKSVPSPAPTSNPSFEPTKAPTGSPTNSPSLAPVTPPPIVIPVTPTPTTSPAGLPSDVPSTSFQPSMAAVIAENQIEVPTVEEGGMGTGGIIGIIIAILALLLAIIALVAYRRKKEREQLRKFAGDQAPEEDLEAPPTAAMEEAPPQPEPETSPEPEPAPAEPEEDDESSAPSVWSESDAEGDTSMNDLMHDDNAADPNNNATVGSALAAMGAASTVAATMMSPTPGSQKAGGDGAAVSS